MKLWRGRFLPSQEVRHRRRPDADLEPTELLAFRVTVRFYEHPVRYRWQVEKFSGETAGSSSFTSLGVVDEVVCCGPQPTQRSRLAAYSDRHVV